MVTGKILGDALDWLVTIKNFDLVLACHFCLENFAIFARSEQKGLVLKWTLDAPDAVSVEEWRRIFLALRKPRSLLFLPENLNYSLLPNVPDP